MSGAAHGITSATRSIANPQPRGVSYKRFGSAHGTGGGNSPLPLMRMTCALDARAGRAELCERIAMFARFAPRALALIAFAISLSACAIGAPATPQGSVDPLPQTTEYRLGPGDKLRVSVFNREELTG